MAQIRVEDLNRDVDDGEFMEMVDRDLSESRNGGYGGGGRRPSGKEEKEGNHEEEGRTVFREILSWIFTIVFAVATALLIKNYLIINANVPTGSMENTIMPGDRLVGNRLAYTRTDPKRGDIVIFKYPDDERDIYVKRIIGLPGEQVLVVDGKVYINDFSNPLEEDYLKEEWVKATGPYSFFVPEDCYLMLGDNRNDSWDARYWQNKYVSKDKILGKAVFIYWPFDHAGKLE